MLKKAPKNCILNYKLLQKEDINKITNYKALCALLVILAR